MFLKYQINIFLNKTSFYSTADSALNRQLLTTSSNPKGGVGGICAADSGEYVPARWVNGNGSPGKIWYWLNENDCDSDYKKGE